MLNKPVFSLKDLMEFDPAKNAVQAPASESGEAPLTPEQLANLQSQQSVPAQAPAVPQAAQAKAPVSQVKESFQATQSPEQKATAQTVVDAQNPLEDTDMKKALEAAQSNRSNAAFQSNLAQIMAGMGSLGGRKVDVNEEPLKALAASANAPVSDITAQRDAYKQFLQNKDDREKNDPNSSVSKTMRDALAGMGVKIPENASYAGMEKLAPQLMKNKEFQMKLEEMRLKREELGQNKQAAAGSKADLLASKDAEAFRKAYDPQLASSRSVLGKEASRYVQSQHAMNLIKDVGDLAKITPMQKRELAVALATMLSPGIPHESTIHALDEKTLNSELASMVQKVTGAPASTNTAGLTKQLKTSVANQQKVSAANIKKSQEAIKATFGKQISANPELYNQVMKSIDLTSDDVKPSEHQNKPKTVIQNGHTYTLNEATGEYE